MEASPIQLDPETKQKLEREAIEARTKAVNDFLTEIEAVQQRHKMILIAILRLDPKTNAIRPTIDVLNMPVREERKEN